MQDQAYLLKEQYRDASNLRSRSALHIRFSTARTPWFRWMLDFIAGKMGTGAARILELGCGTGALWTENLDGIPDAWTLTLTDLSPGMLDETRAALAHAGRSFNFAVVDAESIPFPEGSFDAVIANHMLFHAPRPSQAISEIRRVLAPGGRVFASTLGERNFQELFAVHGRLLSDAPVGPDLAFSLENGKEQLEARFDTVVTHRFDDTLRITEVEPLIAYVRSNRHHPLAEGEAGKVFRAWADEEIRRHGAIVLTKDFGLFEAW